MQGGFVYLWRRFFEHEVWRERRTLSRAEAWLDIFANLAAFEPHTRKFDGSTFRLARGEFVASDRFLSTRWLWSRGKVRRYLQWLAHEDMLQVSRRPNIATSVVPPNGTTCSTTNGTTYLVTNYEVMQNLGPLTVPLTGPPNGTKENKGYIEAITDIGASTPAELSTELSTKKGKRRKADPKPKRILSHEVPVDWEPKPGHYDLAKELEVNIDAEVVKFREYEFKVAHSDWDKAFYRWLRNAHGWKPTPGTEAAVRRSETPGKGRNGNNGGTMVGEVINGMRWTGERWQKA